LDPEGIINNLKAIENDNEEYTQELARCSKLAESNPDVYLSDVADTLNNFVKIV